MSVTSSNLRSILIRASPCRRTRFRNATTSLGFRMSEKQAGTQSVLGGSWRLALWSRRSFGMVEGPIRGRFLRSLLRCRIRWAAFHAAVEYLFLLTDLGGMR